VNSDKEPIKGAAEIFNIVGASVRGVKIDTVVLP
jgi:hypothetical protein